MGDEGVRGGVNYMYEQEELHTPMEEVGVLDTLVEEEVALYIYL